MVSSWTIKSRSLKWLWRIEKRRAVPWSKARRNIGREVCDWTFEAVWGWMRWVRRISSIWGVSSRIYERETEKGFSRWDALRGLGVFVRCRQLDLLLTGTFMSFLFEISIDSSIRSRLLCGSQREWDAKIMTRLPVILVFLAGNAAQKTFLN